jgi:hypothetical protein
MSDHDSSRPDCITIYRVSQIESSSNPNLANKLEESRTQASSETGFMMRFDDPDCLRLNVFDVVEMPGESYPVPRSALESLPAHIQADLEREDVVQLEADYDSASGEFVGPKLHAEDKPFAYRASELMEFDGVSFLQAADYIIVEERDNFSLDEWREVREVSKSGLQKSIRSVESALGEAASEPQADKAQAPSPNETGDKTAEEADTNVESPIPSQSE